MITVDDITGHDMHAATVMGQVGSMLRQANPRPSPYSPASAVTALGAACSVLPIEPGGTLVHARLDPVHNGPRWRLTWSNAVHPPPLLRTPDAHVALLTEHDIFLHQDFGHPTAPSTSAHSLRARPCCSIPTGSSSAPATTSTPPSQELVALLARHGDGSLPHLVRRISKPLADPHPGDDVVVLAVRVP